MGEQYRDDEIEIDLMELFHVFLKKAWLIIGAGVICAALALVGTKLFITPMYESSTMIYMLAKNNAITSALDITLGSQMTDDFMILVKSRPVVEEVIKKEKLDLSYEQMVGKVSVTNPSNTQILKISVQDADPVAACELANAMAEATSNRVAKVMNTEKPTIVEEAIVTENPVSPSTMKNTVLGGMAGAVLVMGIIFVNFMLDDRIKTEDDIAKYLELNTLASIPKMGKMDKAAKKADKKKAAGKQAKAE